MSGPPVAVAAVRSAVRRTCVDVPAGGTVLVACSGGADSLALATAALFESRAGGWRVGLITVDHALQEGSARRAADLAEWASSAGFDPVAVATVQVAHAGGPEAAARAARYEALDKAAAEHGATAVLLGHTRDDQAETVLLGLARGSGARSLAGMPSRRGIYRRPLLELSRAEVRAAVLDREPWQDPHNADPTYARARVRQALSVLQDVLGAQLPANLARSARLLRADADALEAIADAERNRLADPDGSLPVEPLRELPDAVRSRVIRGWLVEQGVPVGSVSAVHVDSVDALLTRWRGQGPAALPRGFTVIRRHGRLRAYR